MLVLSYDFLFCFVCFAFLENYDQACTLVKRCQSSVSSQSADGDGCGKRTIQFNQRYLSDSDFPCKTLHFT